MGQKWLLENHLRAGQTCRILLPCFECEPYLNLPCSSYTGIGKLIPSQFLPHTQDLGDFPLPLQYLFSRLRSWNLLFHSVTQPVPHLGSSVLIHLWTWFCLMSSYFRLERQELYVTLKGEAIYSRTGINWHKSRCCFGHFAASLIPEVQWKIWQHFWMGLPYLSLEVFLQWQWYLQSERQWDEEPDVEGRASRLCCQSRRTACLLGLPHTVVPPKELL